jgi:hypothetical protein
LFATTARIHANGSDPLIANPRVEHAQVPDQRPHRDQWAARGFRRAPLAARKAGWPCRASRGPAPTKVLTFVEQLAPADLAFALGQDDERPDDHEPGQFVAHQADVAGRIFPALAEYRLQHVLREAHGDVRGIGIVEHLQTDARQPLVQRVPETVVDQGAACQRIGTRQRAAGQQARSQNAEFGFHLAVVQSWVEAGGVSAAAAFRGVT